MKKYKLLFSIESNWDTCDEVAGYVHFFGIGYGFPKNTIRFYITLLNVDFELQIIK